jgi:crotonobetainyl-CoA:carnitine CoA-transferase CaiB-like acyl-CoA transferase
VPALVATTELPGTRAPLHGEHSAEVLREAGIGDAEIAGLRDSGTVL